MEALSAAGADGSGATGAGRERFLSDAAARGLDVEIVERLAAHSLEEAAQILGITPADALRATARAS